MGIIDKMFNPLTHSEDLDKEIKKNNKTINDYNILCKKIQDSAIALYELRKESLKGLLELNSYVTRLTNCPDCITESSKRAISFCENIKQAWDFENAPHDVNSNTGSAANAAFAGAAAAGGAAAMAGPTIAMAFATTFGTASTGAAISSLGGAAAANAALAWLGGGAVAAGGGGMAAGAAWLGLMGPIGLGIAGLAGGAMIIKSMRDKKKNDEKISEIREKLVVIEEDLRVKNKMFNRLSDILRYTREANGRIDLARLKRLGTNNFSDNNYPHSLLFEYVNNAKYVGKLSKESINVNIV